MNDLERELDVKSALLDGAVKVINELMEDRDALQKEMDTRNMAAAKALDNIWKHIVKDGSDWQYPAEVERVVCEKYTKAIRNMDRVQDERAASFARLAKAVGGVGLTAYQPEVDLEIESRINQMQFQLGICRKDYDNICEQMTKYLGREFKSHATDAVLILLNEIDELHAEIDKPKLMCSKEIDAAVRLLLARIEENYGSDVWSRKPRTDLEEAAIKVAKLFPTE
jgi:hypothetical protein